MARFSTPSTNVSFNTHLRPPFSLGTTNQSLNLAGSRIFPRVTSGGTEVNELRGIEFLYALADVIVTDIFGDQTTTAGTVQVTSPMTISAATSISISPEFVINSGVHSTITLQCNPNSGFSFVRWRNQAGTLISTNNPATISLSTAALFEATTIEALVDEDFGGGPGFGF